MSSIWKRAGARLCSALLAVALCLSLWACSPCLAQGGLGDKRVMLQGFYWESNRYGNPASATKIGDKRWYDIVKENAPAIHEARFDMIWLPPPSFAGSLSAGYNPKEYFKLENNFGDFEQHRKMLEELLKNGVEPIADIVINHRDGSSSWADFKNPDWGLWAICRGDEAFSKEESGVKDTPEDQRGADEERPYPYVTHSGTTYQYPDYRDIDHTNKQVRRDIIRYLRQLKSMGYRGWRYDMVHGYHARWVALYNKRTSPTFSVGEYDWERHDDQRGWIVNTATTPGDLRTASCVFDFTTQISLKKSKGNYPAWYAFGNGLGMMGDTSCGLLWKNWSVTFVENHDTGYRTKDSGEAEGGHEFDNFANNWEVEQAYAYILTHPGIPCVYWKHYFQWGDKLRERIKALINARKVAGVNAGSRIYTQDNAFQHNVYAAMVEGGNGELYVRVGGSDDDWRPELSKYRDYREYAAGDGWKVWVKLPGNPEVRQAPLDEALAIPEYRPATSIEVPDALLDLN